MSYHWSEENNGPRHFRFGFVFFFSFFEILEVYYLSLYILIENFYLF